MTKPQNRTASADGHGHDKDGSNAAGIIIAS
jgi:hypothetical protein